MTWLSLTAWLFKVILFIITKYWLLKVLSWLFLTKLGSTTLWEMAQST